ncbi:MAG TPA: sigma-70 family RNA polymerase sigma factor [Verrucomicrobiae bacterium]|jgi:RNA polymerase sigma-70 factor (ECF subfamily)|nr:sigma-70 family RNA polymerase sigma factor [Verrucomicrobiae bacterium]
MFSTDSNPKVPQGARQFPSTHWSVVVAAGDTQSLGSSQALEKLCRAYWYPLYAFVRRRGWGAHDSQDLTQAFFAHLLEYKAFGKADTNRGKFRSFLLASLTNFLSNERDKAQRLKRGGGVEIVPLDMEEGEKRYYCEPASHESPETIFARQWAQTVVEQVAGRLREELVSAGQGERFETLKDFIMGDSPEISYAEAAGRLGLSVAAVTSAIHRMRSRFRELFRDEIANTVEESDKTDEEIRYLLTALGG